MNIKYPSVLSGSWMSFPHG